MLERHFSFWPDHSRQHLDAPAANVIYNLEVSQRRYPAQAVQLHGATGVVDELNVSHYFKRLTMIDMTFGDADHHLARFSDALRVEGVGAAS